MAENAKSSTLYIVDETTAGTPVDVSAGTSAFPLQPGYEAVPNITEIVSDELRASIGASASIPGIQEPTFSGDFYLRGSGTQGTAPRIGMIFETALGAPVVAQGTERTLTTGSTTTVINLAAGGSDYALGKALLLKDGTNGYSIRNVYSVATNALTLAMSVPVAPLTGVTAGKHVFYAPAGLTDSHPTRTIHLYRGAGGSHETIAGALVETLDFTVDTGELINMSTSWRGSSFYFNPIRIDSTNNKIDITDDTVTDDVGTIVSGLYANPHDLADAVTAALLSASPTATHVCTYNSLGANKGRFTITAGTSATLSILWKTGVNGSDNTGFNIGTTLGFSEAADDTGSTSYTSDNVQTYVSGVTPSYDSTDPMVAKYMEVLVGDQTSYESVCVNSMSVSINNEISNAECISAQSGVDSVFVSGRTVEISITATFSRHDADKFDRFLNSTDVRFCANFGPKSGGNWVAGKCFNLFSHSAKISAVQLDTGDGDLVTQVYTIKPYIDSAGNGEFYINQL